MLRLAADAVVTVDEAMTVHRPGVVDIDGDRIVWVGSPDDAPAPTPDEVREVGGLLMPGLVNTHGHTPMTLLRGAGEGLPLERWLREVIWPREVRMDDEDAYWGMLLGADELLRCGVTTTCEMYLHEQAVFDALDVSGMRAMLTPGIFEMPGTGPDGTWQRCLERAEALHERAHGHDGRVSVGFGPHAAYTVPAAGLVAVADTARRLGALVQIHLAETAGEGRPIEEEYGVSVPRYLERLGVLEARVLAAHSIWLSDDDLECYRVHDVAVAHCPQSNAKLGSGVARLADMLDAGLRVGLGVDGPASNNDLDLWDELRLAPMLARATSSDASLIPAADAVALATRGGATALGLDTGVLAAGRLADVIRLELDDSRFTPSLEDADLVAHLAWSASSALVTDVWVGSRQVVASGRCLTVDDAEARRQVTARARRLAEEA